MRQRILKLLGFLCILGIVIAGGILIWRAVTMNRSTDKLETLRAELREEPDLQAETSPESAELPAAAEVQPESAAEEIYIQSEVSPAETFAEEPTPADQEPQILPQYADLADQYPDFAGWITIGAEDIIDAIVVRGSDNDFYLDHDFTGASAWGGSIFMDCQDSLAPLSRNTILYGHHLADQYEDRMFGELMNYKNQDYAFENQTFYFASPYQEYEATIFACYSIYPSEWRLYSLEFADDQDFLDYCQEAMDQSLFDFGVTIRPEDQIITLSTCDYIAEDYRFLVHAVLRAKD